MSKEDNRSDAIEILKQAISDTRPIVGIFGVNAGWNQGGADPVTALVAERVGRPEATWRDLLQQGSFDSTFYEWITDRYTHRIPSEGQQLFGNFPFSSVFTTIVDPGFANLFSSKGREPEVVVVGDSPRSISRSRRRPPVYYLFGRSDLSAVKMRPPRDRIELIDRRTKHCLPMLRLIKETATSLGLIVIDGFDANVDWLNAGDLLAALVGEPRVEIIWCGEEPFVEGDSAHLYGSISDSEFFHQTDKPFAELVATLSAFATPETTQRWDEPEIVSVGDDKSVVTTPALRLATQASSTILDDSWTGFLEPLESSEENLKFEFFHGAIGGLASLVEGVRRGYSFRRDFQMSLSRKVRAAIYRPLTLDHAIVLHGQSGVGKTVSLVAQSISIRENKSAAVLYSRNRVPNPTDVTPFLELVDQVDEVTVIVCDAMVEPRRYDDFLDSLRSRGHRVVVLGSTYRIEEQFQDDKSRFIEAPADLSETEQSKLEGLMGKFKNTVQARNQREHGQHNVLARFYRDLPVSRGRIAVGLGNEARIVEAKIRSRGRKKKQIQAIGALGKELIRAGFKAPAVELLPTDSGLDENAGPAAIRIIDCVMAVSRLYKQIPINLVLRSILESHDTVIHHSDLVIISDLFQGIDLFRWEYADNDGEELLVSARLQLEAELICNTRLDGPGGEIQRILDLINCCYRAGPEGNEETRFLTNIVYALGPDGPFRDRYMDSYIDLARALTNLRKKHNVLNARLMLQEATLRRSYIRLQELDEQQRAIVLDEATSAINDALQAIDKDNEQPLYVARRTKEHLLVERAATYGFLATHSAQSNEGSEKSWGNYLAAREAVRRAVGQVDTYFPLDIGLWLSASILKHVEGLSEVQRIELQVDIQSTLDLVEVTDLDNVQAEKFQKQRMRIGNVLQSYEVVDDAFDTLIKSGSCAGIYLRAKSYMPSCETITRSRSSDISAEKAIAFLNDYYENIRGDARCLHLLLVADWLESTGQWPFAELRQAIPIEQPDCERIKGILADYVLASEDMVKPKYKYLYAVLSWLTGNENASRDRWRQLSTDTDYVSSGRTSNRHTIRDARGRPVSFIGIVEKQVGKKRWRMQVSSLGRTVDLLDDPKRQVKIEIGKTVKNFGISFNYLGPIADFFVINNSS